MRSDYGNNYIFICFPCFLIYYYSNHSLICLQQANGWPQQLLSVACLSLAAKMEEPLVPSLVDLQVYYSIYLPSIPSFSMRFNKRHSNCKHILLKMKFNRIQYRLVISYVRDYMSFYNIHLYRYKVPNTYLSRKRFVGWNCLF